MGALSEKNVGDIVKIKENDVEVNFIIIHKGNPNTSIYDDSCDGVWLLREEAHSARAVDAENNNDYENSDIEEWLNGEYLNSIDTKIRETIKQVKIPFKKGAGSAETGVQTASSGLSCKAFLLSGYEVGITTTDNQYFLADGEKLSYFLNGGGDATARAKRVCNGNGSAVCWWLRSACKNNDINMGLVNEDGYFTFVAANSHYSYAYRWARPAFVLPSNLLVASDGSVSTNALTITSDKAGNLGTLTEGFICKYSVNDADAADTVTVTLTLDGVEKNKFTATSGVQYTYSLMGNDWLKISSGTHTFKISATAGKDTAESAAIFARSVSAATITLETPLDAGNGISACLINVEGSIPEDAICKYEVTNNANDSSPAWEDCTVKSKAGLPYTFENKTAASGFAFNFRVSIKRSSSNVGGYISRISGRF